MRDRKGIFTLIESPKTLIELTLFAGFLVIGLNIFDNYGVHWDEYSNEEFGHKWLKYIQKSIREGYPLGTEASHVHAGYDKFQIISDSYPLRVTVGEHDLVHGPAFELLLTVTERMLGLSDSRDIIFMRHLVTFVLFFVSVFIFYLLCKDLFESWKIGLLGVAFLVIHPRIFSHSFYNSVDIGFLAFYIISTYTLITFLRNHTYTRAFFHALACALLIDIRVIGLVVPFCTCLFFGIEIIVSKNKNTTIEIITSCTVYVVLLALFIFLFWPYLWSNPLENFFEAAASSRFTYSTYPVPPWYYNFVWIFATTPILYSLLLLIGLVFSSNSFIKSPFRYFEHNEGIMAALCLFFFPILLPIALGTRLFDGWRHHYFVYPMFIIVCLEGVKCLFSLSNEYIIGRSLQIVNTLIFFIILLSLSWTLGFIIKNHPHENTYSNIFAGKNKRLARFDGAIDYWGLAYRNLLEHIIANNDGKLRVYATNWPGYDTLRILLPHDRSRLEYTNEESADFLLTNYRSYNVPAYYEEYFVVRVDGEKVAGAYKLKKNRHNEKY